MNLPQVMRAVVCAAIVAVCVAGAGWFPTQPVAGQENKSVTLHGAAALDQLKQTGQYESLQAAMNQARFNVSRVGHTPLGRAAWHAPNPAAGYDAYVTEEGVSIMVKGAVNDESYVSLSLHSLGYGAALRAVAPGEVSGDKQTITIERDGVREWYVNGPDGLEHGFTLSAPPGLRQQGVPLRLALQVNEGWRAVASEDGRHVTLHGAGDAVIEYGKLVVHDTLGRNLPARLAVADEQVVIEVEDHDAEYPLTIDPLFTLQQRLLAADGAAQDRMGWAVALSGDTALVGAPNDDAPGTDQGSAYIFVRNGAVWTQQQKLTANDGAANDQFGLSVALDGDTALVGAIYGPGAASPDQGAVYVFVRNGTAQGATWTFQQKLNANDGASGELFGGAVALDGNTALAGARVHRVGNTIGQGAAYIFVRNGTVWTLQKQLTANDGEELDQFGAAVALDGDTALIGAPNDNIRKGLDRGSAYVFTRSGATQPVWTQQKQLTDTINADDNDQFGSAVALSGDRILIGIPLWGGDDHGVVAAFNRGATGWQQVNGINEPNPTANAHFGVSVALDGDTAVVGASLGLFAPGVDRRAAFVAFYDGDWNQLWQFGAGLGTGADRFGYAVALDGGTVLVGANQSDAAALDQGAAYAFVVRDSQHGEQQKLMARDGADGDRFGAAVAVSGDTLAVGAPFDDIGPKKDQGSVYVFTRSGAVWTFQQQIIVGDSNPNDNFGAAVALSGDVLAVGAPSADNGPGINQGAVFIYTRNGAAPNTSWTLQKTILANGAEPGDNFGAAVALEANTLLVGAPFDDVGAVGNQGSAYVFTGNGTVWTQQAQLFANAASPDDRFGSAVALSGDTAAVGAPRDETGQRTDEGSVYVFTRGGITWTRRQQLNADDGRAGIYFGSALALSGDTLMVGAPNAGVIQPSSLNQGAVYAFARNVDGWTERQKLTANDKAAEAYFGAAVALGNDRLVAGAPGTDNGRNARLGAAYVFTGGHGMGGTWTQQQKLTASDGATNQLFGGSVALSNETAVVGAPYDIVGTNLNQGSVYVFVSPVCRDVTLALAALPNAALNAAYRQPFTASGSGVTAYQFAVSGGALPPGLTLDRAGLLSGTPTATGTYRFIISATQADTLCTGSRAYTLTVTPPCPALTLAPATLPNGKRGAPFNQTLATTGGVAPYRYTVTTGELPPGLSLGANGSLSGAPMAADTYNFTVVATDTNGCTATRAYALTINTNNVATVSAASYRPAVAPESIAAAFGVELSTQTVAAAELPLPTELAGVRVRIRDSQGVERLAPLFFVSPGQINFQVPRLTASGTATISVSQSNGNNGATGQLEISRTAPGLFTANADGQGAPAALALRVRANGTQSFEQIARFDGARFVPAPIDLGPVGEQVYLVLYGTGFRFQQQAGVRFSGEPGNVLFAGAVAGLVGLDQANVLLPRSLIGAGELFLTFSVDGVNANPVRIHVR